jgi:hypothetical protein
MRPSSTITRTVQDHAPAAPVPGDPADQDLPFQARAALDHDDGFVDSSTAELRCQKALAEIIARLCADAEAPRRVLGLELRLLRWVLVLGRALYVLYLARAEEVASAKLPARMLRGGKWYERRPRACRILRTVFGRLQYWRTYMQQADAEEGTKDSGWYPLDQQLGLCADGFTLLVVSLVTRLATRMPYAAAGGLFKLFLGFAPAHRSIEQLVLGLGAHARTYQEQAPAPEGDGEVLVIQIDSKGIPTATDEELRKRRGKRRPNPHPESKRHRGRAKRRRLGPKPRRKKGDKSKNAKMGTLVVMYTLKKALDDQGRPLLLGPLNLRILASMAPKRYAFQVARREAIKRGFGPQSGRLIQFVSDGDDDLEVYRKEYFGDYDPASIVPTADLPHVLEYLWGAATALFKEGSGECAAWVAKQRKRLFDSRADLIRKDLAKCLAQIPKKGPGNKSKRERIEKALGYLTANADRLDYRRFRDMDLELASGAVEGAVKHVMGQRFDHGGMRWIRERADALLQLRCIEINGQWDDFMQWMDDRLQQAASEARRLRLRRQTPVPLPVPERMLATIAPPGPGSTVEAPLDYARQAA